MLLELVSWIQTHLSGAKQLLIFPASQNVCGQKGLLTIFILILAWIVWDVWKFKLKSDSVVILLMWCYCHCLSSLKKYQNIAVHKIMVSSYETVMHRNHVLPLFLDMSGSWGWCMIKAKINPNLKQHGWKFFVSQCIGINPPRILTLPSTTAPQSFQACVSSMFWFAGPQAAVFNEKIW